MWRLEGAVCGAAVTALTLVRQGLPPRDHPCVGVPAVHHQMRKRQWRLAALLGAAMESISGARGSTDSSLAVGKGEL